jgi:flavin-dependent dehydrogenase
MFLVGDAACQVKPLSHGGIYYGMRCAEILVDCIASGRAQDYEKKWREKFAKEINIGLKIRQVYAKLSYEGMDKVFRALKENAAIIEKFGDFENHSRIFSEIIKSPGSQILLGKLLISIIRDNSLY